MSKNIKLCKGLDIKLVGKAEARLENAPMAKSYAVSPLDYENITPKLLVKVGDKVEAGSALFFDKNNPRILFTSPVSGVVVEINADLEDQPELINQDAFGTWIMKVKLSDPSEVDNLLSATDYETCCK